jgi:hypothetical protein
MLPSVTFFSPALHGASGYWDEVLNLIPLLVGVVLLIYFYFSARRQKKDREREAIEPQRREGREG